jgi:flagellar biosynthetic protein FliO
MAVQPGLRDDEKPMEEREGWHPRALLGPQPWREAGPAWAFLVERFGQTKLLVGIAVVALLMVAFLLPGGEHADPFEGPTGALDLVLKLGAVLALAYVSMAALKRYTSGTQSQRGTLLEVLDSTALGPNRAVYVVRAGERRLVLGVTQHQITTSDASTIDGRGADSPLLGTGAPTESILPN